MIILCAVTVLLVNLLIAMMGNTYSEIASIKNEWMRQVPGLFLFLPEMKAKSSKSNQIVSGSHLNVFFGKMICVFRLVPPPLHMTIGTF
jgi:hypothetical protein